MSRKDKSLSVLTAVVVLLVIACCFRQGCTPPPVDYAQMLGHDKNWLRQHYGEPEEIVPNGNAIPLFQGAENWTYRRANDERFTVRILRDGVIDRIVTGNGTIHKLPFAQEPTESKDR
jgi:hypothetical protein